MKSYASKIQECTDTLGARFLVYPFGESDTISAVVSITGGHYLTKNPLVADLHAAMLLEGTKKRDKKDIQIFLDSIGAFLSFSPSFDRLEATIKVRKQHLNAVLSLAIEMLTESTFKDKELAILKQQFAGALQTEAENTQAQASLLLGALMYEKTHPNFGDATKDKVAFLRKATRKELLSYHARLGGHESLVVSIAGGVDDISPKLLSSKFKKIPVAKSLKITLPKPSRSLGGDAIAVVPGKASINHMVGFRLGITRKHEDYPALMLAARILGNPGFTGRLMSIVREKEGLTYMTYAFMRGFDSMADGVFIISSSFAPSLFKQGRAAVLRELKRLVEKGPTQDEFEAHKSLFLSNWHVRFSKSSVFASALHDALVEEEGLSYLDTFPNKVASLRLADVARVLKDYIQLKHISEAAAGAVEKDALSS